MRTVFIVVALAAVCSGIELPKKLMKDVMAINFMKTCWGEDAIKKFFDEMETAYEKCSKQTPEYTVPELFGDEINRVTRQTEDDKVTKFIEAMKEVKMEKTMGISNLTCVAKELKMWNEDNSVNIDFITTEWLKDAPFKPELAEMFRKGYKTCYKLSQALPTEEAKDPMKRMFGKQQFFQKCLIKTEASLCVMKEVHDYMEEKYGEFTEEKLQKMGLPTNEYEAAVVAKMMKKKTMPSSKKFVLSAILTGTPML